MKRIWIVTELFYTDETSTAYILTEIAKGMSKKYEVGVICGSRSYDEKETEKKSSFFNERIIIKRVSMPRLNKNKLFFRLVRFVLLTIQLSFVLLQNLKKGDSIFVVTNPAPLLLVVACIKRLKGNPYYILVHDVFPENMIPAGIVSSSTSCLYVLLKRMFDKAYRQADVLIVLGRDMKEVMQKKLAQNKRKTQVEIVENWAEVGAIFPHDSKKLKDFTVDTKIDIQYAGNLGRVQGLMEWLSLIKEVNNPCLRYSFWGEGALRETMVRFMEDNNLKDCIYFKGEYRREEQNVVLGNCDIALVTLAKGMYGLGVPSKSYNIMAAGKPILFIGDLRSEIALEIQENEIGFCFDAEDVSKIQTFLSGLSFVSIPKLREMGGRARKLAETRYSKEIIINKYLHLL